MLQFLIAHQFCVFLVKLVVARLDRLLEFIHRHRIEHVMFAFKTILETAIRRKSIICFFAKCSFVAFKLLFFNLIKSQRHIPPGRDGASELL